MAERMIRQLTTSNYDFPTLVQSKESKYVDKTDLLYELAKPKLDAQYFISRPRRFGKSLMLSTLKAMFEGRRELFKGLAIYDKPWEGWKTPHPVYSITMADVNGDSCEEVKEDLGVLVEGLFAEAGLPVPERGTVQGKFAKFLKAATKASPTGKIVVLIDEYDEPLAGLLDNPEELTRVRKLMHDFYEKLKNNAANIRLLMLTGVTKLTKLSVFSGLTHLVDLSMDKRYATLLGYTEAELGGALRENVEELGRRCGMDYKAAKKEILRWYDGYRFSPENETRVVNPVSLGKLFSPGGGTFKSYWETTGGATLVFNRIKASGKLPDDMEHVRADPTTLDVCDAEFLPVDSLLYQSGYLTIKEVIPPPKQTREEAETIPVTESYILAPPNLEIRESLKRGFLSRILGLREGPFDTLLDRAKRQIAAGDVKSLLYESLFGLYASVPPDWRIRDEAEAKRYFLLFASMCGANPQPEVPSLLGYADAVIETPGDVFVFEFKYGRTSDEAMRQIRDRGYADKWRGDKRQVTLIGVNFNPAQRNIDIPAIEPL